MLTIQEVRELLSTLTIPHMEKDLIACGILKDVRIVGRQLEIELVFGYPSAGYHAVLENEINRLFREKNLADHVTIQINYQIKPHVGQSSLNPLPGIKNVIAVSSGKGGVGKSTTAVNLALALHVEGANVGLLDADVYGPSQPQMLGHHGRPVSHDGKTLEPVRRYGLATMSVGYLIEEDTPMIWRGPMVTQAFQQLLSDTNWGELDYLVVDLPPGTGDIQLTLVQRIPVAGAIIITTPQDIALLDARKGLRMFQRVSVPVLGIIENMSTHICSQCGHEEPIFGSGGGERMAEETQVPLLGTLPLDLKIRLQTDSGTPPVAVEPEGKIGLMYRDIARRAAANLCYGTMIDSGSSMPDIREVDD